MVIQRNRIPVAEFDQLVSQIENVDKLFEYIAGEIIEVPSNPFASKIAARIIFLLSLYLEENDLGHITGEAGGYMVSGERYAPDVAFISYDKQPELARSGYNPNPPDIAVEIISNTANNDEQNRLRIKVSSYLSAGVTVLVVNGDEQTVELHQAGEPPQIFSGDQILTIADHLPDFKLKINQIFTKNTR